MNFNFRYHWLTGGVICALVTASSCMDNAYDLSDIDTTVRLNVKELTIPMNLDVITFDQVFDINEDSEVKVEQDENGNTIYAVRIKGDFKSDDIKVNAFNTSKPNINPIKSTLELSTGASIPNVPGMPDIEIPDIYFHYPITEELTSISTQSNNVDKSIRQIKTLDVATTIAIVIEIDNTIPSSIMRNIKVEGLKIQYPKGIIAEPQGVKGTYDSETGVLVVEEALTPQNGKIQLSLDVKGIDFNQSNASFEAGDPGVFTFEDKVGVIGGFVNVYINEVPPSHISFSVRPTMDAIQVERFTGRIEYAVEQFNIDPIELNDLPDLINQEGTSIKLANPQLYLSMSNPLKDYLTYLPVSAGFELVAERNRDKATYTLDLTTDPTNRDNQYVLSPNNPSKKQEDYTDAQYVKFTDLSNILDVNDKGIPSTIKVHVIDPLINETEIKDFKLGTSLKGVSGDYLFYAPLQLKDQSTIKYEDTIDEWNDEDVDKMAISKIKLDFTATTEVPIAMKLTVVPIDKEGKVIKGVKSNTVEVPAKAPNTDVHFEMTGDIKHLDGVKITANLTNIGNDTALAPQMKLNVKNLKATLTGYYEDEF